MRQQTNHETSRNDGEDDETGCEDAAPQRDLLGAPAPTLSPSKPSPLDAGAKTMIVVGAMPIVQMVDQTVAALLSKRCWLCDSSQNIRLCRMPMR